MSAKLIEIWGLGPDGLTCHCKEGRNCPSPGKHPRGGTFTPYEPDKAAKGARVAALTGQPSRYFVIDVDPGGKGAWEALVRQHGGLEEAQVNTTPRGGYHLLQAMPEGFDVRNRQNWPVDGVDIRGTGGYHLVPPSHGYEVARHEGVIAAPRTWLLDMLRAEMVKQPKEAVSAAPKDPELVEKHRAYSDGALARITGTLAGKREKAWEPGDGWDEACYGLAKDLVRLSNSTWCHLTRQEAREAYMEAAPRDSRWDKRAEKWERAVVVVGTEARKPPELMGNSRWLDEMDTGSPASDSSGGSDASEGSGGSEEGIQHRGIELPDDVDEDGAALLNEVRAWLGRHIIVMKSTDLDVLTLWAAHTHAARKLHTTPRLQIDSPVPESGKTTVLEHLERLCYRGITATSISSPALLARLVSDDSRTLLLDEVDRTLDPKKDGVGELIAIINSGYKVGATRPTLLPAKDKGWVVGELGTFAPVVLAGNQPALPDDTRTRIIRVLLLPDWDGVAEESDWELKEVDASTLGARLARWVGHRTDAFAPRPEMPPGCTSRFREKWQPLARIAQAAGPTWLETVMQLAATDVSEVAADREAGLAREKPSVQLLRHIVDAWPEGEDFWPTLSLVNSLVSKYPDTWGLKSDYGKALTVQRLGRMLVGAYGIRSTVEDHADKYSPRGYRRAAFATAMGAMRSRPGGVTDSPSEPPEPSEASEPPDDFEAFFATSGGAR